MDKYRLPLICYVCRLASLIASKCTGVQSISVFCCCDASQTQMTRSMLKLQITFCSEYTGPGVFCFIFGAVNLMGL